MTDTPELVVQKKPAESSRWLLPGIIFTPAALLLLVGVGMLAVEIGGDQAICPVNALPAITRRLVDQMAWPAVAAVVLFLPLLVAPRGGWRVDLRVLGVDLRRLALCVAVLERALLTLGR